MTLFLWILGAQALLLIGLWLGSYVWDLIREHIDDLEYRYWNED